MSLESQAYSKEEPEKKEDQRTPSIEIKRKDNEGKLVSSSNEDELQYLQMLRERFQGVGVESHVVLQPDPDNPDNIIGVRTFELVNQEKQVGSTE